mgnify:CR=1 FL=1
MYRNNVPTTGAAHHHAKSHDHENFMHRKQHNHAQMPQPSDVEIVKHDAPLVYDPPPAPVVVVEPVNDEAKSVYQAPIEPVMVIEPISDDVAKVTEAYVTYVAVDENRNSRPVDPLK